MSNIINSENFFDNKDNDIKLGQYFTPNYIINNDINLGQYFTPKYIVEEILEELKPIIDKNLKRKAELICDNSEN